MSIVEIPGGTATLRDPGQLKVKHRRPIQVLVGTLGQARAQQLQGAIASGGLTAIDALRLDEREYSLILRMNEATLYAVLDSWTIDAPLPQSADDIGEMSAEVYDALMVEAAKLDMSGDEAFTLAAVEDLTSPTGASAGSPAPSAKAVTRRAPSDRKKPSGTRSIASARRSD